MLLTSLPKARRWTEINLPNPGIEPRTLGLQGSDVATVPIRFFNFDIFYAQEQDENFKPSSSEADGFKRRQIDFKVEI